MRCQQYRADVFGFSKDKTAQNHYPEAEAMALMNRAGLQALEILLDEQAAREMAKAHGYLSLGSPGF